LKWEGYELCDGGGCGGFRGLWGGGGVRGWGYWGRRREVGGGDRGRLLGECEGTQRGVGWRVGAAGGRGGGIMGGGGGGESK